MIIAILLLCFTVMVSAVPVSPNVLLPLLSQGVAIQAQRRQPVEATNQKPEVQTPAPLLPGVEQPQPVVPQQQNPQPVPQFLPPLQHYIWSPIGGGPMIVPLQPTVQGYQPVSQPTLPQQPLVFPPYGYFPLLSSPHRNQVFSPYGFPMILEAPLPQTPANQPPKTQVSLGVTPSGPFPSVDAPQPSQQQQQNPQIMYMLQQPKTSPLGSLSSEELEMAAKLGQLGVYLNNVLTNLPAGAVQPVSQAAGLANPEQPEALATEGTSSPGLQQTQKLHQRSGSMANGVHVGLERPAQEAVTVQTPAQPKVQCAQEKRV